MLSYNFADGPISWKWFIKSGDNGHNDPLILANILIQNIDSNHHLELEINTVGWLSKGISLKVQGMPPTLAQI